MAALAAELARRLEQGELRGPLASLASRGWAAAARVPRPLVFPDHAKIIVVGGATLGGSGKTPLAAACAEILRRAGARVALVGHAYRADPGPRARVVTPDDDVREVGDEALECARRLAGLGGVPVVVAKTRQRALDRALQLADVAVVDGPVQTRPRRASLALLALDGRSPWGSGRCPPRGDLSAPREALVAAADRAVAIGAPSEENLEPGLPLPVDHAQVVSRGAWLEGQLIAWDELRGLRVGLCTALARPDRVVGALAREGVRPLLAIHAADHGDPTRPPRRSSVPPTLDLWLSTAKCRTHMGAGETSLWGVPVATLDYRLELGSELCRAISRAAGVPDLA